MAATAKILNNSDSSANLYCQDYTCSFLFISFSGEPETEGESESEIGGDVGLGLTVAVYSLIIIFIVVSTCDNPLHEGTLVLSHSVYIHCKPSAPRTVL